MPILDANTEMLGQLFEPMLQHRFIVYCDGIPSFLIKKLDGLGFDDGDVTIDHINSYVKFRAKRRWNDINMSLYNAVSPSGAQAMMEWARLQYETVTGRAGYGDFYWKDLTFRAIDPVGSVVNEWIIKKAFIKNISNFGSWDWSADEYTTIDFVLANSGCILNY
jgi:hypothetical protein